MLFLEASLLPLMFLSSSFSTQPVYPSKYRGFTSTLCCFITVTYGLIFASGLSSKMAMIYVVMVIPAVMGVVPVEDKVKAVFSYTRVWGLSHVFLGLMHGDVQKAKLYIKFEKSLVKLQKHFIFLNTITIQLLFCSLSKLILCPDMGWFYIASLFFSLHLLLSLLKRNAWKTMIFTTSVLYCWGPLSVSWINTFLTSLYIMFISFPGVPGQDSWAVSTVRSWKFSVLGNVEEYWVPILIRVGSVVLSTMLTIVALPNRDAWKLCMWVWYSNVYVYLLHTAEWYWPPIANYLEHHRQYPTVDRHQRDWSGPCSICLERIKPCTAISTTCGHIFHGECLKKSIKSSNNICPLCRWSLMSAPSS
ncbi:hypothetical protein L9F63_022620 [Diploptera punctata]|uniref:RING-type domain-containing protein n=1 Tax=Diploptera punctata TaxID=6984 RepID=A0AAD7ZMF1_DIPPU|nr:hypothetical protein L9F63_022620 [Diploptera punctata]